MIEKRKPRLGLLGITLDLYEPMYPDIKERQGKFARQVAETLQPVVDIYVPTPVWNQAEIEAVLKKLNSRDLDGIMIVMLTYSPSLRIYDALKKNGLPVLLLNIQPAATVAQDWNMSHLTFNQGVHGAQDMANALIQTNTMFHVITADWRSDLFKEDVLDWAMAAKAAAQMRNMRIGQVGQMPTMGDIQASTASIRAKLGPLVEQNSAGLIYREFEAAAEDEVEAVVKANRENFEIDVRLSDQSHRYAARLQAAVERWLRLYGYDGFTIQFDALTYDGRFKQLHMMASSNLMAKGYGYSAEGDICGAIAVTAGHILAGDAHFTEMYAMDFERDSVLMSHMGEGNWKIARNDRPIRLIDRPLGIGGLENPPTVVFSAQPGTATLVSMVSIPGENFRLVVSKGEILDTEVLNDVEMPYFHYRPDSGVKACLNGWLRAGGSHHQCLNLGDQVVRWKTFCELLNMEFVTV
jgi:L-arabinose isomerase